MKCLHICNDLMGSKVHENLYILLEEKGVEQEIFYPLRRFAITKVPQIRERLKSRVITSKLIGNYHRVFFRRKINYLYKDLKAKVNLTDFDIVHATTFFSDGAIALKIFNEFNIPYIVAIRGTDVNSFLKYRIDLYPLAQEIISKASKLIFISPSLERNFFKHHYINKLEPKLNIKKKSVILFNGLDNFWLNNIVKKKVTEPFKILYIGNFEKNKNVMSLIKAFLILKEKYTDLQLDVVGKGGMEEEEVVKYSKLHSDSIKYFGPIYDKEELQKIYRSNHIFAMTSIGETFGLVYVEALTQGLPILYTKNQGIDGAFSEYVGEAVNAKSINSIADGLSRIIDNYEKYDIDEINFSQFSWENISKSYPNLYKSVLNNNVK